jgi:hypothetical protein
MSDRPASRDCFYDSDKRVWSVEGFWSHPQHRAYHKAWSGEYVIAQEYGNFTNEIRLVKLEDWAGAYTLAWEQMRVCEFCGFTRMAPCKTRQVCPNLTDYRLEDDSVAPREGSDQLEAAE